MRERGRGEESEGGRRGEESERGGGGDLEQMQSNTSWQKHSTSEKNELPQVKLEPTALH